MCLQHLTLLVCVSQTLVLTIISYSVLNDIFQLLKQVKLLISNFCLILILFYFILV